MVGDGGRAISANPVAGLGGGGRVEGQAVDGIGPGHGIARIEERGKIAARIAHRWDIGDNRGGAGGHGLQRRQAETFRE